MIKIDLNLIKYKLNLNFNNRNFNNNNKIFLKSFSSTFQLNIKELIPNRKVLDLVEFYKNYSDIFDEKACLVLKSILKDNDEYYENPVVISSGEKIGTTIEGDYNMKYKNLIVKSLIELLGDILDEYFQSNSNQIQIVNNDMEISVMQNSDVRNINNELN